MNEQMMFEQSHGTSARHEKRREDGVEYKLRVIPGSDGMLELVEVEPRPSLFAEWGRLMQFTPWNI